MSLLQPLVKANREDTIRYLGLTNKCVDEDGDGYPKYYNAKGCANVRADCDDYHADINPAATEIPNNSIDENCDGIAFGDSAPGCVYNPNGNFELLFMLLLACSIFYGRIAWLRRR